MGLLSQTKPGANSRHLLNNRFGLDLPADWDDQSVYRFQGPMEDGTLHHITVTIEHGVDAQDVAAFARRQIKALENEMQGYHELKSGPIELADHRPAYDLVFKWCPIPDREIYQRMVWTLGEKSAYLLTASFSKKTWKLWADRVDRIIRSFTVANEKAT